VKKLCFSHTKIMIINTCFSYFCNFFQLFNFFRSRWKWLSMKCRLLVNFCTFHTFSYFLSLFWLVRARTSSYEPKKFVAGLPMRVLSPQTPGPRCRPSQAVSHPEWTFWFPFLEILLSKNQVVIFLWWVLHAVLWLVDRSNGKSGGHQEDHPPSRAKSPKHTSFTS